MCEIRLPYARGELCETRSVSQASLGKGLDVPIQSVNEYISFSEVDVVEAVENVENTGAPVFMRQKRKFLFCKTPAKAVG